MESFGNIWYPQRTDEVARKLMGWEEYFKRRWSNSGGLWE